jgi:uncharacterized protein (DUF1778 family)
MGYFMTTMTFRISENDKELIKAYAGVSGISTAEFIRKSVIEKIEDDLDLKDLDKAINSSGGEFVPFDEMLAKP